MGCVNQHRVQEARGRNETVPFEQFAEEFSTRVKGIGHVLALMGPWQDPLYVTRSWCIFELSIAMSTEGCTVDILMPPREEISFARAFVDSTDGINQLWETLAGVCICNANASVPSDRDNIMRAVLKQH